MELDADVMFLSDVLFLTSISEHTHYGTICPVDNLTCPLLESELKKVIRSYAVRRFRCVIISVNPQFKALKDRNLVGAPFNVRCKEEHIHNIEQWHRTIKE